MSCTALFHSGHTLKINLWHISLLRIRFPDPQDFFKHTKDAAGGLRLLDIRGEYQGVLELRGIPVSCTLYFRLWLQFNPSIGFNNSLRFWHIVLFWFSWSVFSKLLIVRNTLFSALTRALYGLLSSDGKGELCRRETRVFQSNLTLREKWMGRRRWLRTHNLLRKTWIYLYWTSSEKASAQ